MNARNHIVEVAALLVAARTVVADPARWCASPQALDRDGTPCQGRASHAVRWGALGALDRVAAEANAARSTVTEATSLMYRAASETAPASPATVQVLDLQPSHTATIAIFDGAIRMAPKPEAPTAPDILFVARTVIARPDRWAQGAIALDRFGRALVSFHGGCRFCAAGAVGLAAHVLGADDSARRRIGPTVNQVSWLLDSAAFKIGEYGSYIRLNEHDTHAQVVTMFGHALDMARPEAAREPRKT